MKEEEGEGAEFVLNVNVGKQKKEKNADITNCYKTEEPEFDLDRTKCCGILTSGKPCNKAKLIDYGMCTRCCSDLKDKGIVKYDDELKYFYREIAFVIDDPNKMFRKGQKIRQYSRYGKQFDFNGTQIHKAYYIYTEKDVRNNFEYCTFITSTSPFIKDLKLKKIKIKRHLLKKKEFVSKYENDNDEQSEQESELDQNDDDEDDDDDDHTSTEEISEQDDNDDDKDKDDDDDSSDESDTPIPKMFLEDDDDAEMCFSDSEDDA